MAPKKPKPKSKSSKGPQIFIGLLVLLFIGLGVRQYFLAEEELAKLHKEIFNTTNAVSEYSFSISDLAIIVNTKLSSSPVKDMPAFNYLITHEIGLTSHVGTMELKLADNPVLAETITADIKVQFLFESDHIYLINPSLVYKTLDKEVTFGGISGKLHYTGSADLLFEKFEYKDPKFDVQFANISVTASKKELKFNMKAQAMSVNGVIVNNPTGSFKFGEKAITIFKGLFKEQAVEMNLVTRNKVTSGVARIPVGLIDAAFDETLELTFSQDEEKVMEKNNPKDSFIFIITKVPKKSQLKKNILATFTKAKNIKRDEKYYTITVAEAELTAEKEALDKRQKEVDTVVNVWSKLNKDMMLDEGFFGILFGDNVRLMAGQELIKRYQPTLAKDPKFLALKALSVVRSKKIDQHKYKDDAIDVLRDSLFEIEKALPDHRYTTVLKLLMAELINNKENIEVLTDKLQREETVPEFKLLFQAWHFQHKDPKKALGFLEKLESLPRKAHLYGHLNDLVNQEKSLKEHYDLKKASLLDLADYGEVLVKNNKFSEAVAIMDECLKEANSKNRCHDIREEAVMNIVFETFKSKPDEAFQMAESLLYQRPAGRHAHYAMGWILEKKQNVSKSMEHFSISCAFGGQLACLSAGDGFANKLNDSKNAFYMYEMACDFNSSEGCTKAGLKAEQFNLREMANNYLSKSCNDLKDANGCYQFARNLQRMNKSNEDVAGYLDKACPGIKTACQYAVNVKSGKKFIIPEVP